MKVGPQAEIECPVPLTMLNDLRSAAPLEAAEAIRSLSEDQRIHLALYCYNRSHLRQLGLTVAATIESGRLAALGGTMGEVIAEQSRSTGLSFGTEPIVQAKKRPEKPKPKISLGGSGWVDR